MKLYEYSKIKRLIESIYFNRNKRFNFIFWHGVYQHIVSNICKDKKINFFQLVSIDTPLKMVVELNRLKKEFS